MRLICFILALATTMLASCTSNAASLAQPTPTVYVITVTLAPTPSPTWTAEPPTATPIPTATPTDGTTIAQLYVRGGPSSAGSPLGTIGPSAKVQITGKDARGIWYQIQYPQAKDGTGWVSAQYVQAKNTEAIPIVGSLSGLGPTAAVMQQLNVRSGPGTGFDSLGTLNPRDIVALTGKDSSATWLQIEYSAGPGSRGWVAAGYVEASGLDSLPIVAEGGQVVGTGTPTVVPPTPTPTLLPAADDRDSAEAPAVNASFAPGGMGAIIYSSDVSVPEGDDGDWIAFTPYQPMVAISLSCDGNGGLIAELTSRGKVVRDWDGIACGDSALTHLSPSQPYVLELSPLATPGQLIHVRYTLTIEGRP